MEQQKAFKEKVEFYQNQTKELELRIENLLKLNSSLKERLDSLLKGDAKNSAAALYKEQLVLSEETIENLNTRVKRLLEENRGLKANSTKSTGKACREYEDKVFECENKILAL
jgi:U3 small nucleolar RNA-associated protein 14